MTSDDGGSPGGEVLERRQSPLGPAFLNDDESDIRHGEGKQDQRLRAIA
ncbi:MAG TPA: hypothetical protein VKV96_17530 [Roseiarcus sp.]|nr:hypothetical protein [Roseiarcus sp.]